MKKQQRR